MATYQLWSWSGPNARWLSVAQGTEADMDAACARQYATARKHDLEGVAFVVRITAPRGGPEALGIDVVARADGTSRSLPIVRSDGLLQHDARLGIARRMAGYHIGDPSWADTIIGAYLDPENAAADLDAEGA